MIGSTEHDGHCYGPCPDPTATAAELNPDHPRSAHQRA
jgi:hypothetical protein